MYELNTAELWQLVVACTGGGLLIGYLISEWCHDRELDRLSENNVDLADTIEHLVAKNDAAAVTISELEKHKAAQHTQIVQLEALLQLTPE